MACKSSDKSTNSRTTHRNIEVEMPCLDGMLAGTLALMTGYAEHQGELGSARCRNLMAKKIVANLDSLSSHPQMSGTLAMVMRNLQNHWHTLSALEALESATQSSVPVASAVLDSELATPQSTECAPTRPTAPGLWHAQHVAVQ